MARTRFQISLKEIEKFFNKRAQPVFTFTELGEILKDKRVHWKLSNGMNTGGFIKDLVTYTQMKEVHMNFPSTHIARYTWGEQDIYDTVSGIQNAYFSHYSALYINNLTEQSLRSIYLNYEQTPKPAPTMKLTQDTINAAFSKPKHTTNNYCIVGQYKIFLLNGQNVGKIGVVNRKYPITNIERTIIDCTVRPDYSGGVFEVLKAYINARNDLSVSLTDTYLNKMSYIYPYHQAIGFYLEKAGYDTDKLQIFEKYSREFDFYLTNQISELDYSAKWRIFFPKGL